MTLLETSLKIAFSLGTQSAHFGIPTELKGRVIALAETRLAATHS
jgi:hypothetical protein